MRTLFRCRILVIGGKRLQCSLSVHAHTIPFRENLIAIKREGMEIWMGTHDFKSFPFIPYVCHKDTAKKYLFAVNLCNGKLWEFMTKTSLRFAWDEGREYGGFFIIGTKIFILEALTATARYVRDEWKVIKEKTIYLNAVAAPILYVNTNFSGLLQPFEWFE